MKETKRTKKIFDGFDMEKVYSIDDALNLLKKLSLVKFDETVDVVLSLATMKAGTTIRGMAPMPDGLGKNIKIAVIAEGSNAEQAKSAGADLIGSDNIIEDIKNNKIDFDRLITTPDMMRKLAPLGKILGPKGLMPNPKLGTVTNNIENAVNEAKKGSIEFRADKGNEIHVGVGKISFEIKALKNNINSLISAVSAQKPDDLKKKFIYRLIITSTMGPGLRVSL